MQPNANAQQLRDQVIAADCLNSVKYMTTKDIWGAKEASTPRIRQSMNNMCQDHLSMNDDLFRFMKQQGWYSVSSAQPNEVNQALSNFQPVNTQGGYAGGGYYGQQGTTTFETARGTGNMGSYSGGGQNAQGQSGQTTFEMAQGMGGTGQQSGAGAQKAVKAGSAAPETQSANSIYGYAQGGTQQSGAQGGAQQTGAQQGGDQARNQSGVGMQGGSTTFEMAQGMGGIGAQTGAQTGAQAGQTAQNQGQSISSYMDQKGGKQPNTRLLDREGKPQA